MKSIAKETIHMVYKSMMNEFAIGTRLDFKTEREGAVTVVSATDSH